MLAGEFQDRLSSLEVKAREGFSPFAKAKFVEEVVEEVHNRKTNSAAFYLMIEHGFCVKVKKTSQKCDRM